MGNISDKENTYSFWGHYVTSQGHRQFLLLIFTFLSLMLHYAAITGILSYRELSNLVWMFVWVRSWSSSNMGHLGSVCLSVCLSVRLFVNSHILCASITEILFTENFRTSSECLSGQDLGQVRIWVIWGLSVRLSVRPSVRPHFLCAAIIGILFYRELSNFVYG